MNFGKSAIAHVLETLEQRRLLSLSISGGAFTFEQAGADDHRRFHDGIDTASLAAADLRLEAATGSEPDPIATSVSYDAATRRATFTVADPSNVILADLQG